MDDTAKRRFGGVCGDLGASCSVLQDRISRVWAPWPRVSPAHHKLCRGTLKQNTQKPDKDSAFYGHWAGSRRKNISWDHLKNPEPVVLIVRVTELLKEQPTLKSSTCIQSEIFEKSVAIPVLMCLIDAASMTRHRCTFWSPESQNAMQCS